MKLDPAARRCMPSMPSLVAMAQGLLVAAMAHILSGHARAAAQVFQAEYNLMCDIASCPVPHVALCDGIWMGLGVGLAVHGDVRPLLGPHHMQWPASGGSEGDSMWVGLAQGWRCAAMCMPIYAPHSPHALRCVTISLRHLQSCKLDRSERGHFAWLPLYPLIHARPTSPPSDSNSSRCMRLLG